MPSLERIFLLILFYSQCSARKKNAIDKIQGPWVIRNASENAFPLMGDCPSVEIDPKQKAENNEAIITLKTVGSTYIFTLLAVDQTTYTIYYPQLSNDSFLGSMTVLKLQQHKFLVTQVEMFDEVYFAVLIKKISPDLDKKIQKFWNSSEHIRQVSLLPTKQENCDAEKTSAENPSSLSSAWKENISLGEEMMQDAPQLEIIPIIQLNKTRDPQDSGLVDKLTESLNQIPSPSTGEEENSKKRATTPLKDDTENEISGKSDIIEGRIYGDYNTEDYGNVTGTPSSSAIFVPSLLLVIASLFML